MANDTSPDTSLATSSRVLRDYLYSRLRSGADLSLSDKLLGLVMLGRESARSYGQNAASFDDASLPPQIIGHLKGYLLNSRGTVPGDLSRPDIVPDYLDNTLRGNITKVRA